jgi:hypothetical protein
MNTERILANIIIGLIVVAGILGYAFPIMNQIGLFLCLALFAVLAIGFAIDIGHAIHDRHNRRYREAHHVSDTWDT